jgi:phage FluMu gp28-like protein
VSKTLDKFFMGYQAAWANDPAPLKICQKGRQIGLSYVDSFDSVCKAAVKGGKDVWVMSRDEVQAKEYARYCKRWAAVLRYAASDLGEIAIEDANGKAVKVQVIEFASGARIYALSSNPDAIVGKTGHVKLDEFALHKDQRELYRVAKPVIQWGGTLSIISTHRGHGTVFNEFIRDIAEKGNPMGWSLHTVSIQRAVADGLVEKINAATGGQETRDGWLARQRAECMDEEQWLQEYCCIPADDNSAFITYEMIAACEYSPNATWQTPLNECKGDLFVGVDIGRDHDLTAIWVMERLGDVSYTRRMITMQKETFDAQEHALGEILNLPQVRRCCVDQTGIGRQFAERAIQRFGKYKVEGVSFTGPVKEELAYPVRAAFEDRTVRIPNEALIRSDLRAIKKETTASGNIRFTADRGRNGHADRFWALALALHAGKPAAVPFYAEVIA